MTLVEILGWVLALGFAVAWDYTRREHKLTQIELTYWHREALRAQAFADRLLGVDADHQKGA